MQKPNAFAVAKRRMKQMAKDVVSDLAFIRDISHVRVRSIRSHKATISFERNNRVHHARFETLGFGNDAETIVHYSCPKSGRKTIFHKIQDFVESL